ncbi:MAG TPA: PA0069 family radical SAM protein [Phycisphaerae bacterium]|nr:PA0069 family radical SAM protein [Phycisphaerae bacterium]
MPLFSDAMRPVENPPNPFVREHREWLGPPPAAKLEVYEEHARSILSHNESPDIPYRWSLNPYRGCQHGCAYCYARPTHEYLGLGAGTDFESKITVKVNAAELLARAFARRGWHKEMVAFSGVTDCYQPLEAVYRLTRRCLQVCLDFGNPVGVVTKSYLVARDADVLAALADRASVRVWFSISTVNDELVRGLEPGSPPPTRRFQAMRRLHEAGVPVAVLVSPVIPGLTDRDIPRVLEQAVACGASDASLTPLRLPGNVKEVFLSRLRRARPASAKRVEHLIRGMRGGELDDSRFGYRMTGGGAYWEGVLQLFEKTAARLGLSGDQCACKSRLESDRNHTRQLPLFGG